MGSNVHGRRASAASTGLNIHGGRIRIANTGADLHERPLGGASFHRSVRGDRAQTASLRERRLRAARLGTHVQDKRLGAGRRYGGGRGGSFNDGLGWCLWAFKRSRLGPTGNRFQPRSPTLRRRRRARRKRLSTRARRCWWGLLRASTRRTASLVARLRNGFTSDSRHDLHARFLPMRG